MKREFSSLQKTNKGLQSKVKKLEDQAEAAIKAQTDAEEKAESAKAIRKVSEAQRKEAEEKMAQAEKKLQEALATKEAEIKDADEKDGDEDEDGALVRKSKDADGGKSPFQKEQVLDLTQDDEGDEVPKDAAHEKVSADIPLADKSIEETLQEIDAELTTEKAAEVASQQSSELQIQSTATEEES
ncbi:tropomyosin alpha-1 chain-like [Camellia sinensis]|uniref:tropomyosin alpha-1 chain-like n=1 Tax=Camellia sinensis TaxID=4442 RepID=UPI001036F0F5|nr:tropomyosin alpha-1 chain-like [Camellia sinensis]